MFTHLKSFLKGILFILLLFITLVIGKGIYNSCQQTPPPIEEKKWENIHFDFKKYPELQKEWENKNFRYEDCEEWINAGIKVWEVDFVIWFLTNGEQEEISPVWISESNRKEQKQKEWIKHRLKNVSNIQKVSNLENNIKKECQRQIYQGNQDFAEVLKFTEFQEYEEFLKKKGKKWEFYDLWFAYLKRWLEIESD